MTTIAVAVAGALGALARYGIGVAIGATAFPWPTLAINIAGSFLLGLVLGVNPGEWNETLTTALGVGFLGAFTTFSTFAFEAQSLLRTGRAPEALIYVAASVVVGLVAAAAGYNLARGTSLG